jgi:hypothetical protein
MIQGVPKDKVGADIFGEIFSGAERFFVPPGVSGLGVDMSDECP